MATLWFPLLHAAYGISALRADKALLLDGGRKNVGLMRRELSSEKPSLALPRAFATLASPNLGIRAFRDESSCGNRHQEPASASTTAEPEYAWPAARARSSASGAGRRGGHIPTAVNVPWSEAANDDGTFRSDAWSA